MNCPKCGSTHVGSQERLFAVSYVESIVDGSFIYTGDTDTYYNSTSTLTDEEGHPWMLCGICFEEWIEESIKVKGIVRG